MAAISGDRDKPWKTNLARKAAQRREQILHELEEAIKKAPSFEEALKVTVETLKKKFVRFSATSAYVADGESLAIHIALGRPEGPERVSSDEGPIGKAGQVNRTTVVGDLAGDEAWAGVGLASGSAMVSPVRTDAGLWAVLEIWSDFRDAFLPSDADLIEKVTKALARKTPAA
jgi:putative methionine-R-sulfoxide reductase with GAF domain